MFISPDGVFLGYDEKDLIKNGIIRQVEFLPKKYIINDKATVLIWADNTKTVIKRSVDDKYDKRVAFLTAYFQKWCGLSKNKANKYLKELTDENDLKGVNDDDPFI